MPLGDAAARVTDALTRATSLFGPVRASAGDDTSSMMGRAAELTSSMAAESAQASGESAAAYRDLLSAASDRLQVAAQSDATLADRLARLDDSQGRAHFAAEELRTACEDVQRTLGPWSDVPAAELAGLLAMRRQVAEMQKLIVQQASEAMRAAEDIRALWQ